MVTLYKPKIITYCLPDGSYHTPDGKRVTSTTPGAVRTAEKAKSWYGRYTDGNGKTVQVRLRESKETARRMLNKLAGDAELASVGIADSFAGQRGRPLLEHVNEYQDYLLAKGDTRSHAVRTCQRVRDLALGCRFGTADDIQASAVVGFLGRLRDQAPERVELDPKKDVFTKAEMVAALGIHPASVGRMLACAGLSATARPGATRVRPSRRCRIACAAAPAREPATCTSRA